MKDVRKDLDTAALEEGALQADKVLKQAEALAQKKQRLTVKNKSSKPSKKTRRQDQGVDKETTQNAAEVDEEEEGEAENSEEEEGEAEAEETDRSRESDDDDDERYSDDSDVSKDSSQERRKRKRSSLAIPNIVRKCSKKEEGPAKIQVGTCTKNWEQCIVKGCKKVNGGDQEFFEGVERPEICIGCSHNFVEASQHPI